MRTTAHEFPSYLSHEERAQILEREERVRKFRRSLPRKRKRPDQQAGPVTWIQL